MSVGSMARVMPGAEAAPHRSTATGFGSLGARNRNTGATRFPPARQQSRRKLQLQDISKGICGWAARRTCAFSHSAKRRARPPASSPSMASSRGARLQHVASQRLFDARGSSEPLQFITPAFHSSIAADDEGRGHGNEHISGRNVPVSDATVPASRNRLKAQATARGGPRKRVGDAHNAEEIRYLQSPLDAAHCVNSVKAGGAGGGGELRAAGWGSARAGNVAAARRRQASSSSSQGTAASPEMDIVYLRARCERAEGNKWATSLTGCSSAGIV